MLKLTEAPIRRGKWEERKALLWKWGLLVLPVRALLGVYIVGDLPDESGGEKLAGLATILLGTLAG